MALSPTPHTINSFHCLSLLLSLLITSKTAKRGRASLTGTGSVGLKGMRFYTGFICSYQCSSYLRKQPASITQTKKARFYLLKFFYLAIIGFDSNLKETGTQFSDSKNVSIRYFLLLVRLLFLKFLIIIFTK